MNSRLKKTLYLGLSAFSIVSVAGASLNSVVASAKKTTKKAKAPKKHKKHAKKTAKAVKIAKLANIGGQDASTSAYTLKTGTLTNKPAGLKHAHAKFTDLSSNEVFMAYQKVTLSNHQVFYKVVSFADKSHRGFVSANDVNTVSTFTPTVVDANTTAAVYLKNPGQQSIYTAPLGSTFKTRTNVSAALTAKLSTDPFAITQTAKTLTNGVTSYHIVDLNNNAIQGWVKDDDVASSMANTRYFDADNDLKINFTHNGQTVASQIVNITQLSDAQKTQAGQMYNNPLANDRVLTSSFVKNLFNTPDANGQNFAVMDNGGFDNLTKSLGALGYRVTTADFDYALQNFGTVKVGDTLNVNVSQVPQDLNSATSKLTFKAITPNSQGLWNPADATTISNDEITFPKLDDTQATAYKTAFTGDKNQFINFNTAFNQDALFAKNGSFSVFDGAKRNVTITSKSQFTNGQNGVLAFKDLDALKTAVNSGDSALEASKNKHLVTALPLGHQFHYAYVYDATATSQANAHATLYGQPLTVIYDKYPVATVASHTTTDNGFTDYLNN